MSCATVLTAAELHGVPACAQPDVQADVTRAIERQVYMINGTATRGKAGPVQRRLHVGSRVGRVW